VTEVSVAERYPAKVIDVTLKDFALPSYSFQRLQYLMRLFAKRFLGDWISQKRLPEECGSIPRPGVGVRRRHLCLVVGWFGSFKTLLVIMAPIPLTPAGILPRIRW